MINLSSETERALVARARAGDTGAFGELVLAHQTFVYNLALRAMNDPIEAQDAAQEAMVRAWQALPSFRGSASFRTWLYRITINLCYNRSPQLRRKIAELPVDETVEDQLAGSSPTPEQEFETGEMRRRLHAEIERLSEAYRILVMLRYQQDLSYDEISQATGMPLGTVKTGLFRAHARLKAALAAEAYSNSAAGKDHAPEKPNHIITVV